MNIYNFFFFLVHSKFISHLRHYRLSKLFLQPIRAIGSFSVLLRCFSLFKKKIFNFFLLTKKEIKARLEVELREIKSLFGLTESQVKNWAWTWCRDVIFKMQCESHVYIFVFLVDISECYCFQHFDKNMTISPYLWFNVI